MLDIIIQYNSNYIVLLLVMDGEIAVRNRLEAILIAGIKTVYIYVCAIGYLPYSDFYVVRQIIEHCNFNSKCLHIWMTLL